MKLDPAGPELTGPPVGLAATLTAVPGNRKDFLVLHSRGPTGKIGLMVAVGTARRVWRMRKLHDWIDAEIAENDGAGVELRILLKGTLSYRRTFATRDQAMAEASDRRATLERDGWMAHW